MKRFWTDKNFRDTVRQSLKALDIENFQLIVHSSCLPSLEDEDAGIGSSNTEGAKNFFKFIYDLGFDGIQFGPEGKTKFIDPSPYTSTVFSRNPLFIDLKSLSENEWGNLLSPGSFEKLVEEKPYSKNKIVYEYVYTQYEKALREAFINFQNKKNEKINDLKKKFEEFKTEQQEWLDKDALYEAFSIENNNDHWPAWKNKLDKNIFSINGENSPDEIEKRVREIREKYSDEIEFYKFQQFIAKVQADNTKKYLASLDFKLIGDCHIAFSDRDYWAYQDFFLTDYKLGVPADCFSSKGQSWNLPVLDPEKIFDAEDKLGITGKFLEKRVLRLLENYSDGIRIDHIIGLIDPFVYKKDKSVDCPQNAARLYSAPEKNDFHKYAFVSENNINFEAPPGREDRVVNLTQEQIDRYSKILNEIIVKIAAKNGIKKELLICEDLGTVTNPVKAVMKNLGLSSIKITQFVDPYDQNHIFRGINATASDWIMIGNHDTNTLLGWIADLKKSNQLEVHSKMLINDLQVDEFNKELRIEDFVELKFTEIFASPSKNIQISFNDLLGIKERYNYPGTRGNSWLLRIPNNYADFYIEQLNKGLSLNLPEILLDALKRKKGLEPNSELVQKLEYLIETGKSSKIMN